MEEKIITIKEVEQLYKKRVENKGSKMTFALTRDDGRPAPVKKGIFDFSYKSKLEEYEKYQNAVKRGQGIIQDANDLLYGLMDIIAVHAELGEIRVQTQLPNTLIHALYDTIEYMEDWVGNELSPKDKAKVFALYMMSFKRSGECLQGYQSSYKNMLVYAHDVNGLKQLVKKWGLPLSKKDIDCLLGYKVATRDERLDVYESYKQNLPEDTSEIWKEKFGVVINDDYTIEDYEEIENEDE